MSSAVITEFFLGSGPSGFDQLALGVEQCRPLPLGPSHILSFTGSLETGTQVRAKQDGYVALFLVTGFKLPCIVEHVVTTFRSGSSPEAGLVRFNPHAGGGGTMVELRVVKNSKPPRLIVFNGVSLAVTVHATRPVGRCLDAIATARKFLIDAPVSIARSGNYVFLSSSFACSFDAPFKELVSLVPEALRPETEIEFSALHGLSSIASFKIFPDGRMLLEPASKNAIGNLSLSVKYSLLQGPADQGGILTLREGVQQVAGHELRLILGSDENCFCLLQGKLILPTSNAADGTMVEVGSVDAEFAPESVLHFFVRSTVKIATVEVRPTGTIAVSPVVETSAYLRIVSFSGISWLMKRGTRKKKIDLSSFSHKLNHADVLAFTDFVGEAVWDAALRSGKSETLDWSKLKDLILSKLVPFADNGRDRRGGGYWAKQVSCSLVVRRKKNLESLAMAVAHLCMQEWGLGKISEKIKLFIQQEEKTETELAKPLLSRRVQRHVTMNAFDIFRFAGKKSAHQVRVAKHADRMELEKLAEIMAWWNQWNTNEKIISHSSLMGNHDIFTDTGKWLIPDDPAVQAELFSYMAWIYKRGYDTFISEIQTSLFPLIEDLDMESTLQMNDTGQMDDMFLDEALVFIRERARALQVMYPQKNEFKCYVFSSSGFNKSKGRWKSSFHLVWPDLIVNGDLAPIIRQTTVEYFIYKSQTSAYFKHMQARLVNHYEANIWENVFDQTTSNANNGLRMPFCNKATWTKTNFGTKHPSVENRRCFPIGEILISFVPTEFASPLNERQAEEKALRLIVEAEARDHQNGLLEDQNKLVGDRTQYKQSDKNSIHRTSAFIAGMKSQGGDKREFYSVSAKWIEKIENVDSLTESEIARWIQRGSCRRQPGSVTLSSYNESFVRCYLEADLVWFQGLTIETLRESEKYKKLTPAGQQGLKIRFRKYLQSQAGGGILSIKTGVSDLEKLQLMAEKVRELKKHSQIASNSNTRGAETVAAPTGDEETDTMFDLWHEPIDNLFSFHESMTLWETQLTDAVGYPRGYWVHSPLALTWMSERPSNKTPNNDWGCFTVDWRARHEQDPQAVTVSLYFHCGKVVVSGKKTSSEFKKILHAVRTILTEPDDRLYHKLALPSHALEEDSFPLLDPASARALRKEFELRWIARDDTSAGSEADEFEL